MEERQIYQLTSGAGYVVVVNGNFVSLRYSGSSVHTAVMAFPEDANVQSQGALLHEYRQHMKCPNTL